MQSLQSSPIPSSGSTSHYDIISIGFGPAALSIAIAMRDRGVKARVLFLEKQPEFGWHTGMLLPGTKMQISFIKDLATMRDPRSHFTFLNYLHQQGRLVRFTNLSTLLPFREEFNDYMKWCAGHFADCVRYGQEVVGISPVHAGSNWPVDHFTVAARDLRTGNVREVTAKHVIVANGREPFVPAGISLEGKYADALVHSSQYMNRVPKTFGETMGKFRFAVVGGGQSAVEIAEDLSSRYPNAKVSLITRAAALKPSDDSPFVNEIFDPSSVDEFYALDESTRAKCLQENKVTNYSVVRLPLLEHVYEKLYRQKLLDPNPDTWALRLFASREITGLLEEPHSSGSGRRQQVRLQMKHARTGEPETSEPFDCVVFATGYKSNTTETVLKKLEPLLDAPAGQFAVDRDYRLRFKEGSVSQDAGVWLQGWCESTHGLSDSLLSILSIRGGELLDSILASSRRAKESARL